VTKLTDTCAYTWHIVIVSEPNLQASYTHQLHTGKREQPEQTCDQEHSLCGCERPPVKNAGLCADQKAWERAVWPRFCSQPLKCLSTLC